MATRLRLTFSECEHQGDLDNYSGDIKKCGGTIVQSHVDTENEEGTVDILVENKDAFLSEFKKTESYNYL